MVIDKRFINRYVVNDYRINISDKPKGADILIDVEISFLTNKDKQILQNAISVDNHGDAANLKVKLSDTAERTKAVEVSADGYKLTFKFDAETCEVFDILKVIT